MDYIKEKTMKKSILVMGMILGLTLSGMADDSHDHKDEDHKTHSDHKEEHCEKDKSSKDCKVKKDHKDDHKSKKKDVK